MPRGHNHNHDGISSSSESRAWQEAPHARPLNSEVECFASHPSTQARRIQASQPQDNVRSEFLNPDMVTDLGKEPPTVEALNPEPLNPQVETSNYLLGQGVVLQQVVAVVLFLLSFALQSSSFASFYHSPVMYYRCFHCSTLSFSSSSSSSCSSLLQPYTLLMMMP